MKICTRCKKEKQLSEFSKDKYNSDGLTSIKGFVNDRQPKNLEIIKMF